MILVLWLLLLLTALVSAFALTARVEYLQGRVMVQSAADAELARAGVEYAVSRLVGSGGLARWLPDGRLYRWQFSGREVELRIVDEAGKVDLNQADLSLLAQLLAGLGLAPSAAQRLAGAVVDWRDADDMSPPGGGAEDADYLASALPFGAKDAPFEAISELQRVLGVTPAVYEQLRPLVTVHAARARPEPAFAPEPVLRALGLDAEAIVAARSTRAGDVDGALPAGSGVYVVESRVAGAQGRTARLRVLLRTGQQSAQTAGYTVMQWEQGVMDK